MPPFDLQPRLTQIALAVRVNGMIADRVCPRVPTVAEKFAYTKFPAHEFLSIPDTRIGRTARANQVEFTSEDKVTQTLDYGLESPVPNKDIENARTQPTNIDPMEVATEGAAQLVELAREKRVADLYTALATYDSNLRATLSGSSQWSHADSDPVNAILAAATSDLTVPLISSKFSAPAVLAILITERLIQSGSGFLVEIEAALTVSTGWFGGVILASVDGAPVRTVATLGPGESAARWIEPPTGTLTVTAIPGSEEAPAGAPLTVTYDILGEFAPPPPPSAFSAREEDDGTRKYIWTPPDIIELAGIQIAYAPAGSVPADFGDFTALHQGFLTSSPHESLDPAPGAWVFAARSISTRGVTGGDVRIPAVTLGTPRPPVDPSPRGPALYVILITGPQQALLEAITGNTLTPAFAAIADDATVGDSLNGDFVSFRRAGYASVWTYFNGSWRRAEPFIAAEVIQAVNISAIRGNFTDLNVEGMLTVEQVDAENIRTTKTLWRGRIAAIDSNTIYSMSMTQPLTSIAFDTIGGLMRVRAGGGIWAPWSMLVSDIPFGTGSSRPSNAGQFAGVVGSENRDSAQFYAWRSADGNTLYIQPKARDENADFSFVLGFKNPDTTPIPPPGGITPPPPTDAPGVPGNPSADAGSSSSITHDWDAPTTGGTPTSYHSERATSPTGPWTRVAVNHPATQAVHSGLRADTLYDFRVRAVNSEGESSYTPVVSERTEQEATPPQGNSIQWTDDSIFVFGGAVVLDAYPNALPSAWVQGGGTAYLDVGIGPLSTLNTLTVRVTTTPGGNASVDLVAAAEGSLEVTLEEGTDSVTVDFDGTDTSAPYVQISGTLAAWAGRRRNGESVDIMVSIDP